MPKLCATREQVIGMKGWILLLSGANLYIRAIMTMHVNERAVCNALCYRRVDFLIMDSLAMCVRLICGNYDDGLLFFEKYR
mmetsp:Transcript_4064/g.5903  ORF Transcript_4064/g.5903 Transcript_4064/m.5903 type:complete len:81 (+) Transcript_4064:341-583(+)